LKVVEMTEGVTPEQLQAATEPPLIFG